MFVIPSDTTHIISTVDSFQGDLEMEGQSMKFEEGYLYSQPQQKPPYCTVVGLHFFLP